MSQKVVIIGHSFSSRLSIIRSVAQIGCEVTVVVQTGYYRFCKKLDTHKPIDCYSKYVSHVYYCHRKDKESLIQILLQKCADPGQKVIIIPDSDDSVATIDDHKEVLGRFFWFPYICNGSGSIAYWMEKTHQKEAARSIGLNVAEGVVIDIRDGEFDVPANVGYPCYTKPLATMNGGKGGMRRCDTPDELAAALKCFIATRSRTGRVLVEDYKEINQEYALLGFSDGKEVIVPGILKLLAVSAQNKGIARQGMVMPVGNLQWLVDKFKKLVLTIGFVGVFDIDFYESKGVFYFCEMNLRFGGSGYAYTRMGVNLPAMMVRHFRGESTAGMQQTVTESAIYVNERMCLDDWYNSHITKNEYRQLLSTADICFVKDPKDPDPQKAYERECRRKRVKKFIKKLFQETGR